MKIALELISEGADLPWRDTQVEGVSWIPLHLDSWDDDPGDGDPGPPRAAAAPVGGSGTNARSGGTVLIRMAPGCGYPAHLHVGGESVLVLAGSYADEFGTHVSGQFVHYPPGSAHGPVAGGDAARPAGPDNPACVLYATALGGIELTDRPS